MTTGKTQHSVWETCRFLRLSFWVFHHTDTHKQVLSLTFAFSIHNKLPQQPHNKQSSIHPLTLPMSNLFTFTFTQVLWFFTELNPPRTRASFPRPYAYSVSDCRRVAYTPTPSPCLRSSLSLALRFLGFCSSTSKRITTSSVESMYSNSCMMINTVCEGPWHPQVSGLCPS